MFKTYQIKDVFSSKIAKRFTVDGASKTIVFESKRNNGLLTFATADKKVQDAIEESHYFEDELISVIGSVAVNKKAAKAESTKDDELGIVEYPEVTTFKAAREVLSGEPYNIPATSREISNAEKVFAKAEELGIRFPNLAP